MSKTILVVDDSSSLRTAVRIALSGAGFDVIEAEDGKQALTRLDGRKYHLVISDVNMPNLDGFGFVAAMKQMPAYKYTPVIMLTTEAGDDKKEKGKAAGAKAWIVKPFLPPQLLSVVSKLVMP
ncbi:MAG TPA: response regulator [Aquabacterium sp.]|uniref:response regulator n=1 Tax=Aquabacterium sp. TaxID=1872578 RepID=UPI002E37BF40|nr:response regulator [Aquabacterium sp.]HEX5355833.1 response regulator [Aquabacterium sp.]